MYFQPKQDEFELLPEFEEELSASRISAKIASNQSLKTTSQIKGWKAPHDNFDIDDALKGYLEKIFSEVSPIQNYLITALRSTKVSPFIKILTSNDFSTYYYRYYGKNAADVGGFTDKTKGLIFLRGNNFLQSNVESAIHEGLHLLSHPPGAIRSKKGSFSISFGEYLDEGLTSYFSEVIMSAQKFTKPVAKAYLDNKECIKMLAMLITANKENPIALLGNAYFENERKLLFRCFQRIFGRDHGKFVEYSLGQNNVPLKKFIESKLKGGKNFEWLPSLEINSNSRAQNSAKNQAWQMEKKNTNQPSDARKVPVQSKPPVNGDPASGWEGDNESFTKRSTEFHLKNHYRITDSVQKISDCCTDIDFYIRRCNFITTGNIRGAVLWSPLTKQVTILICIKGKKSICWYNYYVHKGQLYLRHLKCLKQAGSCNS